MSLSFPKVTPTATMHWDGRQTAYIVAGDKTAEADIKPDATTLSRLFLSGILVDAPENARAIVTFGDSSPTATAPRADANQRWPDLLAERLQAAGGTPVAVLNEGISGERVLADRMGVNALARFEEAVLSHPRVDTVIFMMGINDIGWPDSVLDSAPAPTAEEIIDGYEQLIARAHDHGMRIIGATLTPFEVAFKRHAAGGLLQRREGSEASRRQRMDPQQRRLRRRDRFRQGGAGPGESARMLPAFDKGDNLHPERRRLQGDGGVDRPRNAGARSNHSQAGPPHGSAGPRRFRGETVTSSSSTCPGQRKLAIALPLPSDRASSP